jgi:hypothetical protein
VRKFVTFICLWLGLTAGVFAAENYTLADGTALTGDIVKFDDREAMIHTTDDAFTNIAWPQFSQDSLKQLATVPKYMMLAAPFIQPTPSDRPKPVIQVNYQQQVTLPEHPSIIGGLFQSPLGLFILLIVYAANLYAAYEIAVVRGKPIGAVMGVSAVLPIAGPIIFLAQPVQAPPAEEAPPEELPPDGSAPAAAAPGSNPEDIQIVSASWQPSQEEKKPQSQVFSRGKFTLNKRFIETKFAGFIGEPKGDALTFTMEIRTLKTPIAVECIKQLTTTEVIVETPTGQLTVPFADILEFKLTPKTA